MPARGRAGIPQPSCKAPTHELFPGPPVRWRSAHGRCYSSGRQGSLRPSSKAPEFKSARAPLFGHALACTLDALCLRSSSLAGSRPVEQTRAMNTVPSFLAEKSMRVLLSAHVGTFVRGRVQASNPSIERTCQRPLRALWPAAHVELQGLPRFVKRHGVGMRIAKRLIH